MKNTLELYKYSQDGDSVAFPNISNQIRLADYKYSAKRMGNAPSITATVNYPEHIDHLWDDNVYTEFRGERYFLKQLPSSSKDNTNITYKYSIELVSERVVLESVYFFDVVKENTEDDRPVSNSSDFSFSGDVKQFAERFNHSAKWSGVDYTVVVDDDVELEDKFIQFQDQFLYDALKSMYDTYQVPFYFVGKTIHIGYSQHTIDNVLKYGADNALLSISRTNTNANIVNRITGVGSDKNIPYYYPNKHPKGVVGAEVVNGNFAVNILDQKLYADSIELSKPIKFIPCISDGSEVVGVRGLSAQYTSSKRWEQSEYNPKNGVVDVVSHFFNIKSTINVRYSGDISMTLYINSGDDSVNNNYYIKQTGSDLSIDYNTDTYLESGNGFKYYPSTVSGLTAKFDDIPAGDYTIYIVIDKINYSPTLCEKRWYPAITGDGCWVNTATNKIIKMKDIGLSIVADLQPNIGSEIIPYCAKRINTQKQLMPSIYRDTDGRDRFYNAENGKYKDDDGNDITFANQFSSSHPREYIHKDEEIYPTIEGMVNASGLSIDVFSEFAFDDNDNDDVYPAGHEKEGQYVHPYFFGKLRKFDGEHGFNIFDHAIEGQPMTVTMKSGKCSACEFTIGVDEETNSFNPVQVTTIDKPTLNGVVRAGTLIRDKEGNVLCGRWPQPEQQKQERQNDTKNFAVWIALKKDTQTFGDVMPSRIKNYIPESGDKFALLNINLPEAYILAAEDKLEKATIEYMAENNSQKFNYSAKLSRIFFKENPVIANTLNENSKVYIEYGNFREELYVSSYSYSIKESDSLPEVSIELDNEIKTNKGAIDRLKGEIDDKYKKPLFNLQANNIKIADSLSFVRKKTSDVNTTAKKAVAQSTQAIEAGAQLTLSVENVQASVLKVEGVADLAKEEALKASGNIVSIGNEIGAINTSIKGVAADTSKALKSIESTSAELDIVRDQTTANVNRIDESLGKIKDDVLTIEELIGDEYNIWFEPEDQKEEIPTLENFPAKWWSDDEKLFAHDKDLYYSITLGRAWRFMYNDGEPFWEEITDADTIAALTKAQEALDKAEEVEKSVKDLEFLKEVFGESAIMNEYAAILSKMIAVTDANDNIVAGMYGGGIEGLDANGYIDKLHGKLMMFAGATSVDSGQDANFRVYSDGCMFANSGTFGGIIKRSKREINYENISNYSFENEEGTRILDLTKTGSYVSLATRSFGETKIRLPWYSSLTNSSGDYKLDEMLSMIGAEVILEIRGITSSKVTFETGIISDRVFSVSELDLKNSPTYIMKCVPLPSGSGTFVGWEVTKL